nr:hypothetical protein BaRGS_012719 [Batillaria attramentaria]
MSLPLKTWDPTVCQSCGQLHDPQGTHLYDYYQAVDEDLMCQICLQPLVSPLDTRCGHTFCARCLRNYLRIQRQCPIDRKVLSLKECQLSSILVRRLLDKLLVVCPNVDYCEEVLPRCELEAHLLHRCRGAVTRCIKSSLGCVFQGPRSALQSHLWECAFRDQASGKNPVTEGEVSTIEIQRGEDDQLNISIVGGADTPLICTVIQEIFPDGAVSKDGRLLPGDQILEVNGDDLTQASHYHAHQALTNFLPVCRLTVYRERAEDSRPIEKEVIVNLIAKSVRQVPFHPTQSFKSRKGDVLLSINSANLLGLTHAEAVRQIKLQSNVRTLTLKIIEGAETLDGTGNFSPSWIYWLQMPKICQAPKTITLLRSPSGSLGFSIAGGWDCSHGNLPIFVKSVVPETPAAKDGRLKCGDIIVSVNEHSLQQVTHTMAVEILKHVDGAVTLTVISWPGTVI